LTYLFILINTDYFTTIQCGRSVVVYNVQFTEDDLVELKRFCYISKMNVIEVLMEFIETLYTTTSSWNKS